ncbi:MAG: YlxR family protein [Butyrivibrio sp.]|uniref:RNase P modulator RnpM n=1 Tax=Butyrivibrio sp. LB2008 TaxID=1408305 RepID=UPI00047A0E04|nr:YlxR family protein [Butyrivibrio sp. LB2008]MEE3470345.1 YlxR family protein [Butyrivibrio hungatei]MEE3493530.1 YlxR family protein [Butyrivibrio sp.]
MQKKIPTRKCVGCGEMRDKKDLIRVIKTPDGEIRLDTTGRANGRGAYICNSAECLKKAVKNRGLEKSLKAQIPEDILEQMNKELGE